MAQNFSCGIRINHNKRIVTVDYAKLFDLFFYGFKYYRFDRDFMRMFRRGLKEAELHGVLGFDIWGINNNYGMRRNELKYKLYLLSMNPDMTVCFFTKAPASHERYTVGLEIFSDGKDGDFGVDTGFIEVSRCMYLERGSIAPHKRAFGGYGEFRFRSYGNMKAAALNHLDRDTLSRGEGSHYKLVVNWRRKHDQVIPKRKS